jgi:high-affinity nickel permease
LHMYMFGMLPLDQRTMATKIAQRDPPHVIFGAVVGGHVHVWQTATETCTPRLLRLSTGSHLQQVQILLLLLQPVIHSSRTGMLLMFTAHACFSVMAGSADCQPRPRVIA